MSDPNQVYLSVPLYTDLPIEVRTLAMLDYVMSISETNHEERGRIATWLASKYDFANGSGND